MVADAIRLMLFPAMMAFAASSDLLTMTISNRVSLILVGGFFVLAVASGMGAGDILSHVGAGCIVLAVAFGFFTQGWIGGGDAKLAAATALWLGFDHLLPYLLYASLFGGALDPASDPVPHDAPAPEAGQPRVGATAAPARMAACPTASPWRPRRSASIRRHQWMTAIGV